LKARSNGLEVWLISSNAHHAILPIGGFPMEKEGGERIPTAAQHGVTISEGDGKKRVAWNNSKKKSGDN